jgi:5-methylcytosine-specific restriction endonuclease McrBC GTP-binding regulatory subunit McrB
MSQYFNQLFNSIWKYISTRQALGLFIVVLLILVSVLTVNVLIALHIVRNEADIEGPAENKPKKRGKSKNGPRFNMLNRIDEEYQTYKHHEPKYDDSITLEDFCERFRNFAAGQLHLYYSIDDIRRFVTGLGVSKLMILQGMSGTGKTSLAYAMGQFLQNDSTVVPVQPMWKERSDMIGYFNEFTKRFNETNMLRKMYEAGYYPMMYITILDEVNISRVEYYFAEFLSLLELPDENKRYLDVVSDVWRNDPKMLKNGQIRLPANMWFIGTANNDDSTFAISDKVYDRAMIINLENKCEPFEAPETEAVNISYTHFTKLIEDAKKAYAMSDANDKKVASLDRFLIDRFHLSFGNRIMRQMHDYVPIYMACGGSELDAIDDILCKKVLRKLEAQNPTYVRNSVDDLVKRINELFGEDAMPQCRAYLARLKQGT